MAGMTTTAILAAGSAALAWFGLALFQAYLPHGTLAAQMREQAPGTIPIRQIGGLVIVPLYLAGLAVSAVWFPDTRTVLAALGATSGLLWLVGIADDHRHLNIGLRLAAQLGVGLTVAFALDPGAVLLGGLLPYWLERACIAVALVYFVNMTNFMDGMDGMTVVGLGMPLALALTLVPGGPLADPLALAILVFVGALVGFGILNWPPARLYLGDNGSLPLGLASGAFCAHLAFELGLVAAILPFGYYLADTATTLIIRALKGENVLRSHSSHAYQIARRAGRSPLWILARVAALNVFLALAAHLALTTEAGLSLFAIAIAGVVACLVLVVNFRRQSD